jgi:hypothetical protein
VQGRLGDKPLGIGIQTLQTTYPMSTWEYLHSCQATINVTPQWAPKKSRIHDIAIMTGFTDPTIGLSTKDLRTINR